METLPIAVHTAEQSRLLDQRVSAALGVPSYELMSRAGAAACSFLHDVWPKARRVTVICGPGANGGDGYVLARLALARGLNVCVIAEGETGLLKGDARRAFDDFVAHGGRTQPWSDSAVRDADVVVDAIFGTGLSRPVSGPTRDHIHAINASGVPVFSLDVPSGLHSDSGHVMGAAIVAHRTLTFIALKLGFYLGAGPEHAGQLAFAGLGARADVLASLDPVAVRMDERLIAALSPRPRTSHKGAHGHVLVIGGDIGMAGAARLAGEAALRVGAGLVTIATRRDNVAAILAGRPELMVRAVEREQDLAPLIERADLIAVGPGLGQNEWGQAMFASALASARPLVVDADGLNLLARCPRRYDRWTLTPHPGEAGRLLGRSALEIQADRLGAIRALSERYGGAIVLKGAGTLVMKPSSPPSICDRGNPGMASGGVGDVLTGVIAGIAAQTGDLAQAAELGVFIHAQAGDLAARRGERGLIASDLFEHLRKCVNPNR